MRIKINPGISILRDTQKIINNDKTKIIGVMIYFSFGFIQVVNGIINHCLCLVPIIAFAWFQSLPLPGSTHCLCMIPLIAFAWFQPLPLPGSNHCLCLVPIIAFAWFQFLPSPGSNHCL